MLNRISTVSRRFLAARRHGVWFWGTSYFQCPDRFRINNNWVELSSLNEVGAGYDFANLVFDDEYGLQRLESSPKSIVDIGANFGLFSVLASNLFPDATVHAYEPNQRAFDAAVVNLKPFPNAAVYQGGVGAESGRVSMVDKADSRMAQTVLTDDGAIELFAFRDVVEKIDGIDLLKLDCEGAEWDILTDTESLSSVSEIRMEYHLMRGHTLEELRSLLAAAGFSITHHCPENGYGIIWATSSAA